MVINSKKPKMAGERKEIKKAANAERFAREPIEKLAVAAAQTAKFQVKIDNQIQHGIMDGARSIMNIDELLERLEQPTDQAGRPVELHTRENYKIYNCLKTMPHSIRSMEITRGDKKGKIGTNRPLENTICVAIHHIDDKTYGGLCVLREWGAVDMVNIFVGYNPLQTMIWRDMVEDIPSDQFTACILDSSPASEDAPSWAEGIYRIAEDFNKFPSESPLPSQRFNDIFDGTDKEINHSGAPLTFLEAQRSLCVFNFLRALAKAQREQKRVFVWEDGGYLNPIIDEAIQENLSVAEFRKTYMAPEDEKTDQILSGDLAQYLASLFIGSVELTRNGYDMSAAIAERRRMNTTLFSIAASYEKIMLEGDSITLACIDALSQVLYSTGYGLRDRNVLVMGARGNLGRLSVGHLTNLLENPKKQLWGCDVKVDWPAPEPGSVPKWAEWSASDKPLKNVAGEVSAYRNLTPEVRYGFDVIFGWTGGPKTIQIEGKPVTYQTIMGQDVADWLTEGREKANLYLVSGSTKTIEFTDVLEWLEELLEEKPGKRKVNGIKLDQLSAGPIADQLSYAAVLQMWPGTAGKPPAVIKRNFGTQFTFVFQQDGVQVTKTVYLVNNTMPVNFMFYGTPREIMDMTYSQVTSCAAALVNADREGKKESGVFPTDYRQIATQGVYLARKLDKDYDIPPSI